MTHHPAYQGVTFEHLYQDCPPLRRSMAAQAAGKWYDIEIGRECAAMVDPEGEWLCGLCQHRWRRKHRKAVSPR